MARFPSLTLAVVLGAAGTALSDSAPCISGDFQFQLDLTKTEFCRYETLLNSFEEYFKSAQGGGDDCGHNATVELDILLSGSETTIAELCGDAVKNYEYSITFDEVAEKGTNFHGMYYLGGTDWNEEVQTSFPTDENGAQTNRLRKQQNNRGDADRVRNVFDSQAQNGMIQWPGDLPNFNLDQCEMNTAYCCWSTDRQANDNNGNCAEPYDKNCVDSDPGDNTNLCYIDHGAGSASTGFGAFGSSLFPQDDGGNGQEGFAEGPIHCHGLAWADDETHPDDPSTSYKGNNLFFVSMFDHMSQRGYVRNVQGSPMCACAEQMPVASRSDCTQVDVEEKFMFRYRASESRFEAELIDIFIDFNACQGFNRNHNNDNNDLWAYAHRLFLEGKIHIDKLEALSKKLVGDQPDSCDAATERYMYEKNRMVFPRHEHDPAMWDFGAGKGGLLSKDERGPYASQILLEATTNKILLRICPNCRVSHQRIYYKRVTEIPEGFQLFENLKNSKSENENNVFGTDFKLYSSYEDAVDDVEAWDCDGRDYNYGAGFPGDCGPIAKARIENQAAIFVPAEGQSHAAWYFERGDDVAGVAALAEIENVASLSFGNGVGSAYAIPASPDNGDEATGNRALQSSSSSGIVITSSHNGMWGTNDEMFFLYDEEEVSTIESFTVSVQVTSMFANDPWSEVGLMIRGGDSEQAPYVAALLTNGYGVTTSVRFVQGGETYSFGGTWGSGEPEGPTWLKIEKAAGNLYLVYKSYDGVEWTAVGNDIEVDLGAGSILVGRVASAHSGGTSVTEAVLNDYAVERFSSSPSASPSISMAPFVSHAPSYAPTENTPVFDQLPHIMLPEDYYTSTENVVSELNMADYFTALSPGVGITCPEGRGVGIEDCREVGVAMGGVLQQEIRHNPGLAVVTVNFAPPGCYIWAAEEGNNEVHYNSDVNGINEGRATPLCFANSVNRTYEALPDFRGSVCPVGGGVSIEDCVARTTDLGYGGGFDVSPNWSHTPSGCFVHSDGNRFFSYRKDNFMNNGSYQPICSVTGVPKELFKSEVSKCTRATEVGFHECTAAGLAVGGSFDDNSVDMPRIDVSHAPPGCVLDSSSSIIRYNTNLYGVNNGRFASVCIAEEVEPSYALLPGVKGTNCKSGTNVGLNACTNMASHLDGTQLHNGALIIGHWGHTPAGCFISPDGNLHYNYNIWTTNNGDYRPVCNLASENNEKPYLKSQCADKRELSIKDCEAAGLSVGGILRNGYISKGDWGFGPPGCFIYPGDKAIHFNQNEYAVNNHRYTAVCFAKDVDQQFEKIPAKLGTMCPFGSNVAVSDCRPQALALGGHLLNENKIGMVLGNWHHVPPGCSINHVGVIHYNVREDGVNDGGYSPVCNLALAQMNETPDQTFFRHVGRHSSSCPDGGEVSITDCIQAGEATGGIAENGHIKVGGWGHTGHGCFMDPNTSFIFFGTNLNSVQTATFEPVCQNIRANYVNNYVTVPAVKYSKCPEGKDIPIEKCLEAGLAMGGNVYPDGHWEVGGWHHTPPGCFIHFPDSRGKIIHYGTYPFSKNTGNGEEYYQPVCYGE